MHLCIDARIFSPKFTGIGRYTHELVKQFLQLKPDWKFTLFLNTEQHDTFLKEINNSKNTLYQNIDINLFIADEKMYSIQEQTYFLQKLNKVNADLFWFPHFNVPYFFNKKFVVTVHDLTLSKFPGKKMNSFIHRFIYFKILRHALHTSAHILTVSENTKTDIITDEKISENKITIAHNAVGKEFFNFSATTLSKFQYFLYTGQHREHKNIITLVKGFHEFIKKSDNSKFSHYKLILTGKVNPLYPEVTDYITNNNLEKSIFCVGLVSEEKLLELYKNAKAYIFPSFYEGFGIPPLEAMAMKTPVIASTSSCIPEICGDAALYFDPNNQKELTKKLEELVKNKWLEEKLIQSGLEQVKKYDWEKSAKIIIKQFEELA
ncbi:TPA: glycosyltransferase family 1 protein [Candidatus Peregrinibacteria bacterium]|nr:glycosyltransferase family 1 protein [Candidatus Peregrinibacteria bacterium]HIQ57458.1 glycosyltransferase family 4 protein [Candidatus Gracilibacteria bacterium]